MRMLGSSFWKVEKKVEVEKVPVEKRVRTKEVVALQEDRFECPTVGRRWALGRLRNIVGGIREC
jgi:hypothetical protein